MIINNIILYLCDDFVEESSNSIDHITNRKNELTRDTSINIIVYHKISMEVEFWLFAQNRILYHRIQI